MTRLPPKHPLGPLGVNAASGGRVTSELQVRNTAPRSNRSDPATSLFESKLWQIADALRNNMDAAEYKHVVWCLIRQARRVRPSAIASEALA